MKKILAIGGSNSTKSINKRFATYVAHQLQGVDVVVIDLNDFELPLFSPDLQKTEGIPEHATQLNELLVTSDGIVLSLAEYNGCYATAFKNVFDWLSRIDTNVWKDTPMMLMATSPGKRGGQSVLKTAKELFPFFGGNIITDFSLPKFHEHFSESGITDKELDQELQAKILQFQKAI